MRWLFILLTLTPVFSFAAEPASLSAFRLERRLAPLLGTFVRRIENFDEDEVILRISVESENGQKVLCVDEWKHGAVIRIFEAALSELPAFTEGNTVRRPQHSLTIASFDHPEEYYGQGLLADTRTNLLLEPHGRGLSVMIYAFTAPRAAEAWSVFSRVDLAHNDELRGQVLLTEQRLRSKQKMEVTPTAFIAGHYSEVKHSSICGRALLASSQRGIAHSE